MPDIVFWIFALLLALVAAAFALAPRREIVTETRIDAAPARVWSILLDTPSYGDWNPFIVSAKGVPAEGERIAITLNPRGGNAMSFRPLILKLVPDRELRWLGRLTIPRLFDGEHYLVLHGEGQGTRLVHGESFAGVLLWAMDVERFRPDFEAMNLALRRRAEETESGPAS